MAAIERGMELPALPEACTAGWTATSMLLTGMVWLFIGIALLLALGAVAGDEVRFFGLIPAGVGLAYLIYYFIEGKHEVAAGGMWPGTRPQPRPERQTPWRGPSRTGRAFT